MKSNRSEKKINKYIKILLKSPELKQIRLLPDKQLKSKKASINEYEYVRSEVIAKLTLMGVHVRFIGGYFFIYSNY